MRFLKPGRLFIYLLVAILIILQGSYPSFTFPESLVVREGDTYQTLISELSRRDRVRTSRVLQTSDDLQSLQVGTYQFSGTYTPQTLIQTLNAGPTHEYISVTLLEGRSSYDVDQYLADQGLIQAGEYRAFITDRAVIDRNAPVYPFLAQAIKDRPELTSLEGYLYPDTYRLDISKPIISQLVRAQFQAFDTRIWQPRGDELMTYTQALASEGRQFGLSSYASLIIASIVLKEEQRSANMPDVAGVFFNRLDQGIRLGADITLCYGLETGYDACTPESIVANLYDRTNLYNTRELAGLTPTPIASPTVDAVRAVLQPSDHDNLFYLHDPQGGLHMAQTNAQHNSNKSKYLQ